MENIAASISAVLGGLGGPVLVAAVMCLLGLVFRAGVKNSVRGGIYAGIGLTGLNIVINAATGALTPAIQAFSEKFHTNLTVTDLGWGSSGIAFSWPGLAFVILGILAVNALMVVFKLTKTMWTDIWSIWHGNVLGGFVWAVTGGNIFLGVLAGVIFLAVGSIIADITAKDYQEFNDMPCIAVPCTVSFLALFAKPFNALIEKIPGIRDINASPENIRKRMGIFGELGVMGTVIGVIIGILAGYDYGMVLNLGMQIGVLMVFLPKTVSVLCEGIIPVANAITEFVQEKFEGREVYVGVDCAALLGHPSVMASAVLLYPMIVVLSVLLPGNAILPIASLAVIPYWCGAVAAQLKGNVFRIVLFVLLWSIPVFYIATLMAPIHTQTMGLLNLADPNVVNSSFDMGGDPLGALLVYIFKMFGK
ncbi:MAG: PTS galactitol transporter subunit IIC [Clostridiaceae bacterium]|nr:PTS galactitol transporter subunit IIC [Clostridiaceae bacterium]